MIVNSKLTIASFFFQETVRYPVWTCSDRISLILGTQSSILKKHLRKRLIACKCYYQLSCKIVRSVGEQFEVQCLS